MNLAISSVGIAICSLGLMQAIISRQIYPGTRKFFIAIFSVLIVYIGFNLLAGISTGRPETGWRIVTRAATFLEAVSSVALLTLLTSFLLYSSGEKRWWRSKTLVFVIALLILYVILLILTQFCPVLYNIDERNGYERGTFYPLMLIIPSAIILINLVTFLQRRKLLSKRQRVTFLVYLLAPLVGLVMQILFHGLYLVLGGTAISATGMFIYIVNEQNERYARQAEENANLRMEIMLSQIQPHFLYNSLGAIGRLCKHDPEAKEAVNKFARYLRGNMDSMSQAAPVPFETELEHTRIYLELEQLRFGSDLKVEYDLGCTEFLLPTLTLQPIVENAVRHGVRHNETGEGTVTIATREYEDRYEITVSDDGPGFDPDAPAADTRSHIGLDNVRARLRHVSGGELQIDSAPGRGCLVTIVLPKG